MVYSDRAGNPREFEYLCVDDFLGDLIHARALATAFETGLIDALLEAEAVSYLSLAERTGGEENGMPLLLGLLQENRVVRRCDDVFSLTQEFVRALEFRDLMESKCAMSDLAAHDYLDHFSDLVLKPERFFQKAKFCRLFSYERCFGSSREDYEATRRWMRFTTVLTKYEAQACMKYHDFGRYRNLLDIGGNSGEFALRICRQYPQIRAVVFDLPLVCEIGRGHIETEAEADRISFLPGNALADKLPEGFDLITFKSVLHDWPDREAGQLIRNASRVLAPGGTMLIFERGRFEFGRSGFHYSLLPFLLFANFFRSPVFYERQLAALNFRDIRTGSILLEMPFFIVTANREIA